MLSKRTIGATAPAVLCAFTAMPTANAEVVFEGRYNNGVAECRVTKFEHKPISAAAYEAATQVENLILVYQAAYHNHYKEYGTTGLLDVEVNLATTNQLAAGGKKWRWPPLYG